MSNASVQAIGLGLSGKIFVTKMPWASLRPMSTRLMHVACRSALVVSACPMRVKLQDRRAQPIKLK